MSTGSGPGWRAAARAWARWHWRRRTHSIKARLVAVFVLLAGATTVVFVLGTQQFLQSSWQAYVRPLVANYAQHLADHIGNPPDPARAKALAQRLPIAVRIEGPQVQVDTHPGRFDPHHGPDISRAAGNDLRREPEVRPWSWTVQQPGGHRIRFALVAPPASERPRLLGWATLAALVALTAAAYAAVRRQLRPLQGISTGVQAYGDGHFDTRYRCGGATNWVSWRRASTAWHTV